jgi:N-acetylglucosaminyl-diphospho-decaprenol L-rhamnosyltransferase
VNRESPIVNRYSHQSSIANRESLISMVSLDVVIVSHNTREVLANCVASLFAAPPSCPWQVIVVDNASSDGSAELVQTRWPDVHVLRQAANEGFARATNAGIRHGSGSLVLLLNSDTIVPPGALDALIAALVAEPRAGIVGPRLVDAEGRPELSHGRMKAPFVEFRRKLVLRSYQRGLRVARAYVERVTRGRRFADWVTGACLLVWRHDAERAGLLDERYFMYSEDVDFCAAVRALGRRVLYDGSVSLVHLGGRSSVSPHARRAAYRRSQLSFYRKHHPGWVPLLRAYLRLRRQPIDE